MNDELAHTEIARLEERIEEMRQSIARCDKIALAARLAIGGGALWLVLALVTILPLTPTAFFGSLASALGGVVLLGSNKTTREELEAQMQKSEDRRRALIDAMQLRLVEDPGITLH
jgi:hypothetical protein